MLEETDETLFWLELIWETGIMKTEQVTELMKEAKELTAIFVSSLNKAKGRE